MSVDATTLDLFEDEETYAPEPEVLPLGKGLGPRLILPQHRGLSLLQAQDELRGQAEAGTTCPCCGQHAQVYRRRLNSGMALALVLLAKAHEERRKEAFHLRELLMEHGCPTGDYCYLPHWRAISRSRPGSKESLPPGYFRLTSRGKAFALGLKELPAVVVLYGEQVLGFSDRRLSVEQALGRRVAVLEELRGGGAS